MIFGGLQGGIGAVGLLIGSAIGVRISAARMAHRENHTWRWARPGDEVRA